MIFGYRVPFEDPQAYEKFDKTRTASITTRLTPEAGDHSGSFLLDERLLDFLPKRLEKPDGTLYDLVTDGGFTVHLDNSLVFCVAGFGRWEEVTLSSLRDMKIGGIQPSDLHACIAELRRANTLMKAGGMLPAEYIFDTLERYGFTPDQLVYYLRGRSIIGEVTREEERLIAFLKHCTSIPKAHKGVASQLEQEQYQPQLTPEDLDKGPLHALQKLSPSFNRFSSAVRLDEQALAVLSEEQIGRIFDEATQRLNRGDDFRKIDQFICENLALLLQLPVSRTPAKADSLAAFFGSSPDESEVREKKHQVDDFLRKALRDELAQTPGLETFYGQLLLRLHAVKEPRNKVIVMLSPDRSSIIFAGFRFGFLSKTKFETKEEYDKKANGAFRPKNNQGEGIFLVDPALLAYFPEDLKPRKRAEYDPRRHGGFRIELHPSLSDCIAGDSIQKLHSSVYQGLKQLFTLLGDDQVNAWQVAEVFVRYRVNPGPFLVYLDTIRKDELTKADRIIKSMIEAGLPDVSESDQVRFVGESAQQAYEQTAELDDAELQTSEHQAQERELNLQHARNELLQNAPYRKRGRFTQQGITAILERYDVSASDMFEQYFCKPFQEMLFTQEVKRSDWAWLFSKLRRLAKAEEKLKKQK